MENIRLDHNYLSSGILTDRSALLLIFSNIVLIVFALYENWGILTVMFIYWCQSIIIGFFTFLKMITLKDFSTEGVNYNTMRPTAGAKIFMSFFFLFHYGMFHFGYYMFLISGAFFMSGAKVGTIDASMYLVIGVFFVNHLFSFIYNQQKEVNKKPNIGKIMFFPYIRIIPMHLTIIFGGAFMMTGGSTQAVLVLFLLLKTFADVIMHTIEHRQSYANQMKIDIEKANYKPGENIRGKLFLSFERPIKARSLSISFIAEKTVISGSGDSKSTKKYIVHKSEKTFNELEYLNNTYFFDFQIPSSIILMVNNLQIDSRYLRAKEYSQKHPKWGRYMYREFDSFYIQAEFDIPYSLNIKNKKEINIS